MRKDRKHIQREVKRVLGNFCTALARAILINKYSTKNKGNYILVIFCVFFFVSFRCVSVRSEYFLLCVSFRCVSFFSVSPVCVYSALCLFVVCGLVQYFLLCVSLRCV